MIRLDFSRLEAYSTGLSSNSSERQRRSSKGLNMDLPFEGLHERKGSSLRVSPRLKTRVKKREIERPRSAIKRLVTEASEEI